MSLQYGIKEVMALNFYDYATLAPLAYADYAEATSNDVAATRIMVEGGQGNYRLMSFDHTKTSDLKLTFPLVDLNLLALVMGDTVSTAAQNLYKRDVVTIAAGAATISQSPLAGTVPAVYFLTGTRDNGTALTKVASAPAAGQYAFTGTAFTFNVADNGKQVAVWYQYASPSSTTKFSLKANKFTKSVQIVGNGLARDQVSDTDVATVLTFYKAKAQNNFTLTMSSTAATKLELTFDLFAVPIGSDFVYTDYNFLT